MNRKTKMLLTVCLLLAILTFAAGCSQKATPYEINDGENYTVSVKYDANGGIFTTNTSVIVDSYNLSEIKAGSGGKAEIALLPPDSSYRGNDAFAAYNSGYFLAGWYTQRTESTDGEGNPVYSYSGRWDFEHDRLTVDPEGVYTSAEPVLTLYAAWIPLFEVEFYSLGTDEYLGNYTFNPMTEGELLVPAWNQDSGAIDMYHFPVKAGCTFKGAYYDAEGNRGVDSAALEHPGRINYETGTAENASMKVYVDWMDGEWYHIYHVEQFLDNASVSGCYVIHADLDFAGEIWPTALMYGNFSGTIQGNGHTFRNIEITQTNNSKINAGLFGYLTETSGLSDLTFENVTFTIKAGTRVVGTSYGLLAGTISSGAEFTNVSILDSTLQIDSGCFFGVDDYAIGLVSGMGYPEGVDYSGITCSAVGEHPENVAISVSENTVTVEFVSE